VSPLFIFSWNNWRPFLLFTVTFIAFTRVSPLHGVTPHLFYLSDLVCPLFFVNLPTIFFHSGVTPGGRHPGRSASQWRHWYSVGVNGRRTDGRTYGRPENIMFSEAQHIHEHWRMFDRCESCLPKIQQAVAVTCRRHRPNKPTADTCWSHRHCTSSTPGTHTHDTATYVSAVVYTAFVSYTFAVLL